MFIDPVLREPSPFMGDVTLAEPDEQPSGLVDVAVMEVKAPATPTPAMVDLALHAPVLAITEGEHTTEDEAEDDDGFDASSPTALEMHLETHFNPWLLRDGVNELAINKPGELFLWERGEWKRYEASTITKRVIEKLGRVVSSRSSKALDEYNTTLSTSLPDGTRIEMTGPPATLDGLTYVNMRRHIYTPRTLKDFVAEGYFNETKHAVNYKLTAEQRHEALQYMTPSQHILWDLAKRGEWETFLHISVLEYQNIVASGATGSGKTTFVRGLVELIPTDERVITLEDTPEMPMPNHPNVQPLFYRRDTAPGSAGASAKELLGAAMRKTPKRVLLAELRGDETYYYVQSVLNSGHPGGLTTTHANTARSAFMRLALLMKASPEGSGLTLDETKTLLYGLIDVVVQIAFDRDKGRFCSEIYYDPMYANTMMS